MKNRRILSLVLCLCMMVTLFTGMIGSASADDNVITYTVASGDYLFKICSRLGLDYYQCKNAIMILNGFGSEAQLNRLSVGQVIKLPASNSVAATVTGTTTTTTTVTTTTSVAGTTTTTAATSTVSGNLSNYTVAFYLIPHVVQYGETLNSICNTYGVSYYQYASMILGINGIKSVNNIAAGKTIYVPSTKAPSSGTCYVVVAHSVRSGETITSICSQYGVNFSSLSTMVAGLNGNTNLNKIYVGQTIYVPYQTTAVTSAAVVTTAAVATATPTATPGTTGYQISIDTTDNGNPYAIVSSTSYATRAEEGVSVVIAPNAKTGYAVKAITVVRTDSGAHLTVTNNAFTMPASNVKVSIEYAKGLAIEKQYSPYGTADALVYGASATSAFYGDEVVVQTAPRSGYSVKSVTYQKLNSSLAEVTVTADKTTGEYKFTMPNYAIKLMVDYEVTTLHALKSSIVGKGTVKFTVDGNEVQKAEKGKTVTVTVTPDSGWILDDNFTITGQNGKYTKVDSTTYTFKVGNSDVTVKAIFNNMNAYTLTSTVTDGGTVVFTVTSNDGTIRQNASWAKKGDLVTIVPDVWTVWDYSPSDTAKRTTIASQDSLVTSWVSVGYSFYMPDANVRVVPVFTQNLTNTKKYTVNSAEQINGTGTVIVTDLSGNYIVNPAVGSTVVAKIYPPANAAVEKVEYSDGSGDHVITTLTNTSETDSFGTKRNLVMCQFTMPSCDTRIKVTYKVDYQTVPVTGVDMDGNGLVAVNYADGPEKVHMYLSGERITNNAFVNRTVRFNFTLASGYELDRVTVTGGDLGGTEKELSVDSEGYYNYTVTEKDYQSGLGIEFRVYTKLSDKVKYDVLYSSPVNGDYTINGVAANAKEIEGAKVTLSIKANEGYSISLVAIDDVAVSTGDLIRNGDYYEYSFTMPAAKVKTLVNFEKDTSHYTVTATCNSTKGTANGSTTNVTAGETVKVSFTPNANYKVTQIKVNGITYAITDSAVGTMYTYQFTMPSADVTVEATLESVIAAITGSVNDANYGSISPTSTSAEYGTNVKFTCTAKPGYKLTSILVNDTPIAISNAPTGGVYNYEMTVPSSATLTVQAVYTNVMSTVTSSAIISYTNDGFGTTTGAATANVNDSVVVTDVATAGYKLVALEIGGATVTISDAAVGGTYNYTFKVTALPMTVKAIHKLILLPIAASGVSGTVTPASTSGKIGDVVDLVCTPSPGMRLKQIIINSTSVVDISDSVADTAYTYHLTVPDGESVTVQAVFG